MFVSLNAFDQLVRVIKYRIYNDKAGVVKEEAGKVTIPIFHIKEKKGSTLKDLLCTFQHYTKNTIELV